MTKIEEKLQQILISQKSNIISQIRQNMTTSKMISKMTTENQNQIKLMLFNFIIFYYIDFHLFP